MCFLESCGVYALISSLSDVDCLKAGVSDNGNIIRPLANRLQISGPSHLNPNTGEMDYSDPLSSAPVLGHVWDLFANPTAAIRRLTNLRNLRNLRMMSAIYTEVFPYLFDGPTLPKPTSVFHSGK
jgi:hypothetical protein